MFTTSAIFTCDTAPADAFAAAPSERRRMPRLPHDAVGAGRIDRPQDRADIVRILDAVEHDDERRSAAARIEQILDARALRVAAHVGDDALMHAAARGAIELAGRHAPNRDALRAPRARRARSRDPSARRRHADLRDAPGAQRLEDRVDAVDQHSTQSRAEARPAAPVLRTFRALGLLGTLHAPVQRRTNARRALAAAEDRRQPGVARESAPRSIAGNARSSSGPSARPVSATRIG